MKLETPPISKRARVEMIPLIDCMFILLVFFIYSMLSMTLQRGITVELPRVRSLERIDRSSVVLTITESGALVVDKTPVEIDELGAAIEAVRLNDEHAHIVINADTGSHYGRFMRVMDELRLQGVTQVGLMSQEDVP